MNTDKERGAVVVEAIMSLTVFMFTIFTIMSIVDICYIQAKMNVALNSAAKEISQYSFFYYKFHADALDSAIAEGTEDERQLADNTITGVSELMNALSTANANAQSGDLEGMLDAFDSGVTNVDSLVNQYADAIADDPTGFIMGMGKMALNEGVQGLKSVLCEALAKAFMKKNLMAFTGDDPDRFLRSYGIKNGLDDLDFGYTSFLQNGSSPLIQLVVTYDVEVIKLLNIEFSFTIRHCVKTNAWGRGVA